MTERPFTHKKAFTNVKCNFIFHDEFIKIFLKILKLKGIINIGGKSQTIYQFARKYNKNIKKDRSRGELPNNIFMSLKKLDNLLKR
jgi:dTDP-4-dehydrorhamnose reductase